MLLYPPILFVVALSSAVVKAQDTTASIIPTSLPTQASAAKSVLATATLGPDLGSPADILNYPLCAQICANETYASGVGCDLQDLTCVCGPELIAKSAACEQVTCSEADRQKSSLLAQELCYPIYNKNASLGSAVTSAYVSATSAAAAAVASKDATNPASYPLCSQKCINANLPLSGCGSLSNRICVCQTSNFHQNTRPCEVATCSASELEEIIDLANVLCNPVGGEIVKAPNGSYVLPGTEGTPTPVAFTGDASTGLVGSFGWGAMTLVVMLGGLAFAGDLL